ncbi:glycosyltransferase [Methylogaea oryzae]|uniref:Glycosyl transferase family 1 n=2 Tax=Methylogaea oryzae TaxID=1295382 RepID=A0A8D5AJU3_9GAMM|nr:glycosyltransferase [Methylogaea oryzae]BBL70411.1 glycosyl transferase family 1 [Methylogaea oryzae]
MNILFVSDVFFPRVNGVSTSIDTFRREFLAQGHKVWLIAPDYFIPSEDENHILRVSSHYLFMDPEDRLMRYGHALRHLDQLRRENFDIIHIQTPFVAHYLGLRLSRELGIPRVETYHTHFEEYFYHYLPLLPRPVMRYLARWFARHQCNQLQGLIAPSRPMLDVLRHYGIPTPAEIVPTGLEPDRFELGDGDDFRAKHGIPAQRPVLLFVGRVAHEKNIGFLLKVTERVRQDIPDVLFVIAGEGPAQESLRSDTQRLGLEGHVQFIGYLDRNTELRDCYRCADLFVFSSRTETQGLVLLEAMAQAVPLVSTAEMGAKSVLSEGAGVHIASEDVEEFAGKAIALLRDPELRRALGEAGQAYARQWSAAGLAHRMLEFYRKTIAEAAHRALPSATLAPAGEADN